MRENSYYNSKPYTNAFRTSSRDDDRVETGSPSGKGQGVSHQVLRTVQLMCGRSTARDEGLEHGTDDNAFHILGCGFVVHCGEIISKPSLVCNAKAQVKDNISTKLCNRKE